MEYRPDAAKAFNDRIFRGDTIEQALIHINEKRAPNDQILDDYIYEWLATNTEFYEDFRKATLDSGIFLFNKLRSVVSDAKMEDRPKAIMIKGISEEIKLRGINYVTKEGQLKGVAKKGFEPYLNQRRGFDTQVGKTNVKPEERQERGIGDYEDPEDVA